MSDLRVKRQVSSVTRATDDDQWMNLRGTRDGAMITADWLTAMALEGRCFGANSGADTTPDTFSPAYANTMPDLRVGVPSGTTIIPVYIQVNFEDTGSADVMDVMAVSSSIYDIVSTDTAQVIYNMRMDAPRSSNCVADSYVTAGGASPLAGNYVEFWRGIGGKNKDSFNTDGTPIGDLVPLMTWNVKDTLVPPVIVGEGSLNIFASAQAGFGYITAIWVEIPSTSIQ